MITKPIEDLRPEDFQDESLFIKPATHKKCAICKQKKFVTDFYKNSSNSDGLQNSCKECCKKVSKKWRMNNPEKFINSVLNWREGNKEHVKEYQKKYYKNKNKPKRK